MAINLGDKVKDTITGFKGVAVCRTQWLNGCVRIGIQPQELDKDGKPQEAQYFDVEQVELLEASVKPPHEPAGGPMPAPQRAKDAR